MSKYVMVNGKKVLLKDLEIRDDGTPETPESTPETPSTPSTETPEDENLDEQAKSIGQKITQQIVSDLGLGNLKELNDKVDRLFAHQLGQNEILTKLLHGKDFFKDRQKLTKEEVIVGFWHALVTNNVHAVKALSEGADADGGYLFPNEFLAELVKPSPYDAIMRKICRVIPMKRDVMNLASLVAGPEITWTAENAAKTTTSAEFGQPTLTARKAAAILYSSDELIEDSTEIDLVSEIMQMFKETIAEEEDRVFIVGNGTTQPTGLATAVTAGDIASVTCSGNLDFDDVINLVYALDKRYRNNGAFLMSSVNEKELRKVKDTNGQYIWSPNLAPSQPASILGYPVHINDFVSDAQIYFGDFKKGYWIGDRKQMTVKISQDTTQAFTQDMTAIRVVIRVAGNVVFGNALKVLASIP